jgi:uncharacterized protein (DUF2384 family)
MEERATIAEINAKWVDVFWSDEGYKRRLDWELPVLNWEKPRKWLLRNDDSIQEIFNILCRIEHWIFA